MPDIGFVLLGASLGIAGVEWSQRVIADIEAAVLRRHGTYFGWLLVGGIYGAVSGSFLKGTETFADKVLLTAVALLTVVQTPIDARTHRLSRKTTIVAAIIILLTVVINTVINNTSRQLIYTLIAALAVTGVYAVLHRISPRSLGWGDVLLVFPLALALGTDTADRLITWQLLAASSGAICAVVLRLSRGAPAIAFGPHLLLSSWVVLVVSV